MNIPIDGHNIKFDFKINGKGKLKMQLLSLLQKQVDVLLYNDGFQDKGFLICIKHMLVFDIKEQALVKCETPDQFLFLVSAATIAYDNVKQANSRHKRSLLDYLSNIGKEPVKSLIIDPNTVT